MRYVTVSYVGETLHISVDSIQKYSNNSKYFHTHMMNRHDAFIRGEPGADGIVGKDTRGMNKQELRLYNWQVREKQKEIMKSRSVFGGMGAAAVEEGSPPGSSSARTNSTGGKYPPSSSSGTRDKYPRAGDKHDARSTSSSTSAGVGRPHAASGAQSPHRQESAPPQSAPQKHASNDAKGKSNGKGRIVRTSPRPAGITAGIRTSQGIKAQVQTLIIMQLLLVLGCLDQVLVLVVLQRLSSINRVVLLWKQRGKRLYLMMHSMYNS